MIAALMAYGAIASLLLLVAGLALEVAVGGSRFPRRIIWSGAMLLSCGLTVAAGLSFLDREEQPVATQLTPTAAIESSETPYLATESPSLPESLQARVADALRSPITAAAGAGFDGSLLLAAWAIASASLLAIGIGTTARSRRLRGKWELVEMDGLEVRLSPTTGPAVLGTFRPEIVVPGWLLSSSAEERRLALLHESEHLRARDGILLGAGWAAVAVLPWNLPLWWMVLRLRLAIEIDCDRRVLAAGAERRSYGSMLIDVSGHTSGFSLTAPALVGFPSPLERRLVALTTPMSGFRWIRGSFGTALGGLAFLAACQTDLPTAADIEAMDAAAVAEKAEQLGLNATTYYIDGELATPEQAGALVAGSIGRVEVTRDGKNGDGNVGTIRIFTRNYGAPAFIIDGREATQSEFNALDPDQIANISVRKDASAAVEGFRASNGTVLVTTKSGSEPTTATPAGVADGRPTTFGTVTTASAGPVAVQPVGYGQVSRASAGTVTWEPATGAQGGSGEALVVPAVTTPAGVGPVLAPVAEGGYTLSYGVKTDSSTGQRSMTPVRLYNMGDPLYVIDGEVAEAEDFNRIDPANITGISVLKAPDPSQYADPRARNGVVLITTSNAGQ